MKFLTQKRAIELIDDLQFPKVICDIINERTSGELHMTGCFSSPALYAMTKEEQEAFKLGEILPLWSPGSGSLVYAYDMLAKDYISFYLDADGIHKRYSWEELIKENISNVLDVIWDEFDEQEIVDEVKKVFSGFKVKNIEALIKEVS